MFLGHFGHFVDFVPVGPVNDAQQHKVVSETVITWTEYVLYSHMSVGGSFGSFSIGHWSGHFGTFSSFLSFSACRASDDGPAPQSHLGNSHNLDRISPV